MIANSNLQINESVKSAERHKKKKHHRIHDDNNDDIIEYAVKLAHHIFVVIFALFKCCCAIAFAIFVVLLFGFISGFTSSHLIPDWQLNNLIIWRHPNRCRYVCDFFFFLSSFLCVRFVIPWHSTKPKTKMHFKSPPVFLSVINLFIHARSLSTMSTSYIWFQ